MWRHQTALIIVAHPDDEILWAGGTILMHSETQWTVAVLCRRTDPDRAPKFHRVMEDLGATGSLGDLDDGPEQSPLTASTVQEAVLAQVGRTDYDLILTHDTGGEYTRHRRHEEIGAAVLALWDARKLQSQELWTFAYGDKNIRHAVRADKDVDVYTQLPEDIWAKKRELITGLYGFAKGSFEEKAALREEAFRRVRINQEVVSGQRT